MPGMRSSMMPASLPSSLLSAVDQSQPRSRCHTELSLSSFPPIEKFDLNGTAPAGGLWFGIQACHKTEN
ncbi:hypothetical protein NQZ68_011315 [Dissostichus eleginoides]|nr:hypothetical protein NQZ68_011315 [Dissostichus eleginoides]